MFQRASTRSRFKTILPNPKKTIVKESNVNTYIKIVHPLRWNTESNRGSEFKCCGGLLGRNNKRTCVTVAVASGSKTATALLMHYTGDPRLPDRCLDRDLRPLTSSFEILFTTNQRLQIQSTFSSAAVDSTITCFINRLLMRYFLNWGTS